MSKNQEHLANDTFNSPPKKGTTSSSVNENSIIPIGGYTGKFGTSSVKQLKMQDQEVEKTDNSMASKLFKKKRSERYDVNSNQFKDQDERKYVDARFWLFMGVISNTMF